MAWEPSVIISGGMYAGQGIYEGDLSGLFSYMTNLTANANVIYGLGNYQSQDSWEGAFGIDDGLIREYGLGHKDNQFHYFDLMIIDIPNPEGATYYKQQLVVRAYTRCTDVTEESYTEQGVTYSVKSVQLLYGIDSIKRAQYLYPYSDPTFQDIGIASRGLGSFTYKIEGYENALGRGKRNHIYDKCRIPIGYGIYNNVTYFAVGFYLEDHAIDSQGSVSESYTRGLVGGASIAKLDDLFGDFDLPEKKDPNEDDEGESGEGGGDGDHDKTEDPIPIPASPDLGAADAGFITLYRMNNVEIHNFAAEMVDPDVWAAIKAFFMDPMDFITGIMLVPFTPPSTRRAKPAFFTGSNYFDVVANEFVDIDCGSIAFPLFYKSAFDFNPYSRYILYLPYIGYVELDADDVAGQIISVKYRCDCLTGDCVAFVTKVNPILTQVIAQYSGNCGVRVPYGRTSFDAAISASIQLLGGGIGMAVGAAGAALGLDGGNVSAGQLANQVSNASITAVNGAKVTTERSGVAGASAGYMSLQKPHLIRNIPHQSLPANYRHLNGYPSNIGGTLSQFDGFTAVESIELSGIGATDAEKEEILSLLTRGVYI